MKVSKHTHIARPPEAVWAILADFGNLSSWAPNVDHATLTTAEATGIGATRRVQVGRNALLERIVEWQDGASLAYEIEGLPVPMVRRLVNGWRVEAADGGTHVTLTSDIDANPILAWVLSRVLLRESGKLLTGLKAAVEKNP